MLAVARATMSDWARLYAWRNDLVTRAMFVRTRAVTLRQHLAWLRGTLSNDQVFLAVVRDMERAAYVGTFRLDLMRQGRRDGWIECSVTVDAGQRGRGYGPEMVRLMAASTPANWPTWPLRASIKSENYASLRAFADAGFEYLSQRRNIVVLTATRVTAHRGSSSTPVRRQSPAS